MSSSSIPLSAPAALSSVVDDDAHRHRAFDDEAKRRLDAVDHVALFASLPDDDRAWIARKFRPFPVARGELLARQGEDADWLYVVTSGEVSVRVRAESQEKELARLGPGAFFGEMSLLTGEPVWPIVERPVPTDSDVPGEKVWPTQPFPTKPPPFARQGVTLDDANDLTPEIKAIAQAEMLRTFNCGVGMVAIVAPEAADAVADILAIEGETVFRLGRVEARKDAPVVFDGALDLGLA